jgi:hypothetical protein
MDIGDIPLDVGDNSEFDVIYPIYIFILVRKLDLALFVHHHSIPTQLMTYQI